MLLYTHWTTVECKRKFYMHWENRKINVTHFIGDIHFIAVVWNWNYCISEMYVYSWQKQKLRVSLGTDTNLGVEFNEIKYE